MQILMLILILIAGSLTACGPNQSQAVSPSGKRWTVADIKKECLERSKEGVKELLGPPDRNQNGVWYYTNLRIYDPDSEKELHTLILDFSSDMLGPRPAQAIVQ